MSATQSRPDLAAMLGFLHQTRAEGELVLEQNDGTRRLYLKDGDLSYLSSDAVGEQFGNYLIRLGVLDYKALKDLLAEKGARVGDRVVQWGLLTAEQRDARLRELFGNILLHAVEHPVLNMVWNPGALGGSLGQDLQFNLDHRRVVWDVYRQMQTMDRLAEKFESEPDWKWRARDGLLDALADLTLTPQLAFAITQLGPEPMGFETLASVTGLDEAETARLLAALWALGGLELAEGVNDAFPGASEAAPQPQKEAQPEPPPEAIRIEREAEPESPAEPEIPAPLDQAAPEPPVEAPAPETGMDAAPQVKARVLFRQAEGLNLQGRTSEAIRALELSIQLDPDSPRSFYTWMMLGELREGNPAWSTRAIEAYQAAARALPRKGEPWLRMGELYHRKGFSSNAAGCFHKAAELDPLLEVPHYNLPEEAAPSKEGVMGRLRGLFGGEKK